MNLFFHYICSASLQEADFHDKNLNGCKKMFHEFQILNDYRTVLCKQYKFNK
mgnify:CR=1 FL=1